MPSPVLRTVPLRAAVVALTTFAAAPACDATTILAPADPEAVAITLGLTGGLAGADYSFRVDGARGEVRGVRCVALCDFAPGDLLGTVSHGQVAYLAGLLDRAGAIGLDGRNFGQGCCDYSRIELRYDRGDRTARISGSEDRLPESLGDAVSAIAPLVRGTPSVIVAPHTTDADWPRDPYELGEVVLDGPLLRVEVSYSGGCALHPMDLVLWGGWMESYPVQINALISHRDADDPCDAIVSEVRSFDLGGLARAYRKAYGPAVGEPIRVILRLRDPIQGSASRTIEVQL